jgi:hypothetical protein
VAHLRKLVDEKINTSFFKIFSPTNLARITEKSEICHAVHARLGVTTQVVIFIY